MTLGKMSFNTFWEERIAQALDQWGDEKIEESAKVAELFEDEFLAKQIRNLKKGQDGEVS